jgi:hypothetical protein
MGNTAKSPSSENGATAAAFLSVHGANPAEASSTGTLASSRRRVRARYQGCWATGRVDAAYFNPHSIRVSKAEITREDAATRFSSNYATLDTPAAPAPCPIILRPISSGGLFSGSNSTEFRRDFLKGYMRDGEVNGDKTIRLNDGQAE